MAYRDDVREIQSEGLWTLPRFLVGLVLFMAITFGVGFLATGGSLLTYKFWAPKQANAERQVFENTQSYVQGKTEYLTRLRFQYGSAEGAQKIALKQLILDEASTVDNNKLPVDLQGFIAGLKEN